jgi:peptide/nickel transport system substrate-binding protein
MNIDDVIFNMYVLSDPTYDGSSTFYALPIEGMADYRSGMTSKGDLILAGGREGTSEYYTDAERDEYWTAIDKAGAQMAQGIVDYVFANYLDDSYTTQMLNGLTSADVQGSDGLKVAYGMAMWGYGSFDDAGNFIDGQTDKTWDLKTTFPTVEDYWTAISTKYKDDVKTASDTEKSDNGSLFDFLPDILGDDLGNFQLGVETGTSAKNISGIIRNDDYSMTVHMTSFDAVSIYQLSISVAPMHYYGSKDAYDYANNKFGFTKGDLSGVKSVNTKPLGAGPYKFLSFEKGVITYEANESYYKGTPKIKNVLFKETAEGDKLTGVTTGTFDLTDPTFNTTTVDAIKGYNSNGELTGDVITTSCVDNLGYGYIGMNANLIKVGTTAADNGSDKSKDLRKALATLFAVHRDVVIDSYYGERATVIQYPDFQHLLGGSEDGRRRL